MVFRGLPIVLVPWAGDPDENRILKYASEVQWKDCHRYNFSKNTS
jgi:hypothetical protein